MADRLADPLAARMGIAVDVRPEYSEYSEYLEYLAAYAAYAAYVGIVYLFLHATDAFASRRDPATWRLGGAVAAVAAAAVAAAWLRS